MSLKTTWPDCRECWHDERMLVKIIVRPFSLAQAYPAWL